MVSAGKMEPSEIQSRLGTELSLVQGTCLGGRWGVSLSYIRIVSAKLTNHREIQLTTQVFMKSCSFMTKFMRGIVGAERTIRAVCSSGCMSPRAMTPGRTANGT